MRFGPTSIRLTGIVARGLRRPNFRGDLRVSKQVFGGEVSYVFKIPETDSFNRLAEFDWEVVSLCDGTRTPGDISLALSQRYPDQSFSEVEITGFLESIDPNAWEQSPAHRNLCILEKIRDERRQRVNRASLLYIYFSSFDPDKPLEWLSRRLGWMFTKQFVAVSLAAYAMAAVLVGDHFAQFRHETAALYTFSNKSPADIAILWIMLLLVVGPHEFAHGLACKHYGGEVHHMGFMLLYFSPSFYTDCTDMHLFDSTSKRVWTIIAGIWITLWQCCLAIFVWSLSQQGSAVNDLAYKFAVMTGIPAFMQLNPLMKIDGYYILSQYLQIDNLREESSAYLASWSRRYILGRRIDLPEASRREARIFLTYGSLAVVYGLGIVLLFLGFVNNVFTSHFGNWGYLATSAVVLLLLRKRLKKLGDSARTEFREAKEKFMAWKMRPWQQAAGGTILFLLMIPPTTVKVTSDFVLEPVRRVEVRARVPGLIEEVAVREGESAPAGSLLAVLHNPGIKQRRVILNDELQGVESSFQFAQAKFDFGSSARRLSEIEQLRVEVAEADRKAGELILRAPFTGVVTTPQVDQRVGEYLQEGQPLTLFVDRHTMRARILVRDWELEDVRQGARVGLKLRSYPFRTFPGHIQEIMPAAALTDPLGGQAFTLRDGQELTNFFEVDMEFPNPDGVLREGMTGIAKIYGRRYPIAWRMARATYRWLHSQIW